MLTLFFLLIFNTVNSEELDWHALEEVAGSQLIGKPESWIDDGWIKVYSSPEGNKYYGTAIFRNNERSEKFPCTEKATIWTWEQDAGFNIVFSTAMLSEYLWYSFQFSPLFQPYMNTYGEIAATVSVFGIEGLSHYKECYYHILYSPEEGLSFFGGVSDPKSQVVRGFNNQGFIFVQTRKSENLGYFINTRNLNEKHYLLHPGNEIFDCVESEAVKVFKRNNPGKYLGHYDIYFKDYRRYSAFTVDDNFEISCSAIYDVVFRRKHCHDKKRYRLMVTLTFNDFVAQTRVDSVDINAKRAPWLSDWK